MGDPASHPGCRVPALIAGQHCAVTPPQHLPCCCRGPILAPVVVPQHQSPQNPSGMHQCHRSPVQSYGWHQDAPNGTHPIRVQTWPSLVSTALKPWPWGKNQAGKLVGLGALCCGSLGTSGTSRAPQACPAAPPSEGCTRGMQVGDQPGLRSRHAPACPASPSLPFTISLSLYI